MMASITILCPLLFLGVAVIDDLCFQKFHNWLFLTLSAVGLGAVVLLQLQPLTEALGGFLVGGGLMLPLVLIGAIGAGDMKFMMCFGIIMGMNSIFEIFVIALFWGALIGILQSVLAGRMRLLITNLKNFSYQLKPTQLHKIPYTVAIAMAWLTHFYRGDVL